MDYQPNLFNPTLHPPAWLCYAWVLGALLCVIGCDSRRVYDTFSDVGSAQGWTYEQTMPFATDIADTATRYNIYVNVRHTDDFPYSNLWVKLYTTFPSGKRIENRINLPLADKSGKWFGEGSGDVITAQVPIQEAAKMPETGAYRFEIAQDMRQNPLTNILAVGIRIEQAK